MSRVQKESRLSVLTILRKSFLALFEHFVFFIQIILIFALSELIFALMLGLLAFFYIGIIKSIPHFMHNIASLGRMSSFVVTQKDMAARSFMVFAGIAFIIFSEYLSLGVTKIVLNIHDNKKTSVWDLFSCYHLIIPFILAGILRYSAIVLGLILILPGIFLAVMFSLYKVIIVDQEIGPVESLKKSYRLVRPYGWQVFAVFIAELMIQHAAMVLFGIFSVVLSPVYSFVYAYLYRILQDQNNQLSDTNEYVDNTNQV